MTVSAFDRLGEPARASPGRKPEPAASASDRTIDRQTARRSGGLDSLAKPALPSLDEALCLWNKSIA